MPITKILTSRKPATAAAAKRAQARAERAEFRLNEHTSLWSRPGFLVRRLHQIHVAMFMEELAAEQVTPVQYGLLSILVDMPGLDQFSIAEELGIDRANVHDVLKRLESRKLLLRVVDPHNKRRKICLATQEGAEFVARHHAGMQAAQKRLLQPLTDGERTTFLELLHKLVNSNNGFGRTVLRPSRSKFVTLTKSRK
jgi:MarR family transcriptional regulator, lower aerobic nicotinate degradation pathway regulator